MMNLPIRSALPGAASRRQKFLPKRQQRGLVLEIVLVVVVALMLASIALFRSVDSSSAVATNIAFKSDANNRAQLAFDQIFSWLSDKAAFQNCVSNGNNCPDANFSAQMLQTNAKGVPNILAGDVAVFDGQYTKKNLSAPFNSDGMQVRYLIERMCTRSGSINPQYCTMYGASMNDGGVIGRTLGTGSQIVLRATVRVDGPRNTVAFLQTNLIP